MVDGDNAELWSAPARAPAGNQLHERKAVGSARDSERQMGKMRERRKQLLRL